MTHLLLWLLLYPPVAALTTAVDARAGISYDDPTGLMWSRIAVYVIGTALIITLHYV